jgi:adenine-specific DNA methylase
VSRATATYNVHAYHTKVPVEAIGPYVEHYTVPGATVLDPFAGSGMTGLAAALRGRRAILNDLSPAAVHIARNYTTPCPAPALSAAADRLLVWARPQIEPLYAVSCPQCGGKATTEYVVWSDVRSCPHCSVAVTLWDARTADGGMQAITCPSCYEPFDKNRAAVVGERPVSVNMTCDACGRDRVVTEPRPEDVARTMVARSMVPYWYPDLPFGDDWEMWRGGHRDLGVTSVADFWSNRNLSALSVMHEGITREPDARLREALFFVFTAILNRASRRYQWNAKRPTNVLGGTLYIASLRYEWNVLSLFGRKLRAATAFYRDVQVPAGAVRVEQGSATDLRSVASGSVDYCFTDPPFGANIYYADASLLWEAWLGTLTDRAAEAVVSRKRAAKSLDAYQDLMARSLVEMRRCLRDEGTITMVFQNTNAAVWQAIRDATVDAGLHLVGATTLHKSQPSFKGIKGTQDGERVAATDVVMTLSRTARATRAGTIERDSEGVIRDALKAAIDRGTPPNEAGHLYAVAMSALLDAGFATEDLTFDQVAEMARDLLPVEQLALPVAD